MICPLLFIVYGKNEGGDCIKEKCAWWVRQEAKDLTVPHEVKPTALIGGCAIKILAMRRYDGHTTQDK